MSNNIIYELETYSQTQLKTINELLGNICLTGVPNQGFTHTMQTFLTYALQKKQKTIIFTNKNSTLFTNFQQYRQQQQQQNFQVTHIDFSDIANSDSLNPFISFSPTDKKDLILEMFSQYKKLNEADVVKLERYVLYILRIFTHHHIPITLDHMIDYDIDALLDLVEASTFRDAEKRRMTRFFNEMYSQYLVLESYLDLLNVHGLGDILTGEQSMETLLQQQNALLFTLDQQQKQQLSNVMLKLMSSVWQKTIPTDANENYWVFIDGIQWEDMQDLHKFLRMSLTHPINCVYTVEDIAALSSKYGNSFVEHTSSFFVFTQNSYENCNYWSQFFGTYEQMEMNYTYTPTKKIPFQLSPAVGKRPKQQQTSMSTNRVQKPLYKPEVFQRLKDNEAIMFLKEVNRRKKLTIQ